MGEKRRQYTRAFELEAVRLLDEGADRRRGWPGSWASKGPFAPEALPLGGAPQY